jgi:hypothetical protein
VYLLINKESREVLSAYSGLDLANKMLPAIESMLNIKLELKKMQIDTDIRKLLE